MKAVVLKKAERLRERLSLIAPLATVTPEVFMAERPRRDLCAFYLILAVEECRDLAEHLIAENAWGAPESAGEEFELLAQKGVIDAALARRMRQAVGLRNLLVHEYAEVDWVRVHSAANDLSRLSEFLAAVLRFSGLQP
ncbi:type VII toxin-antitoxin system HepT family RNase toxin [Archangium violaceum]|uniref:type VII toxin-antitoxin system HepT family RNase toxin n=1 Tax=Archangium violaceum TaxID=83451 RepID=UPI000698A664|nr:DUF86 domain-containing protein [Archangium violaceum]